MCCSVDLSLLVNDACTEYIRTSIEAAASAAVERRSRLLLQELEEEEAAAKEQAGCGSNAGHGNAGGAAGAAEGGAGAATAAAGGACSGKASVKAKGKKGAKEKQQVAAARDKEQAARRAKEQEEQRRVAEVGGPASWTLLQQLYKQGCAGVGQHPMMQVLLLSRCFVAPGTGDHLMVRLHAVAVWAHSLLYVSTQRNSMAHCPVCRLGASR